AYDAIARNRERLKIVSKERVCEEFFKLLGTPTPSVGLWILYQTGLINEFLPEVSELNGVEELYGHQHKNNLVHTFKVVDNISERTDNTLLRFAALMHDIGKPGTKSFIPGRGWAFDMHEHLGRKIVRDVGRRLRMSKGDTEYVALLVRWHQQPIALMDDGVTDSPVRRLIVNLKDKLDDLLTLCRSDITTGNPYKLKKRLKNYDLLEKRIAEVTEKDKLRAFQSPVRGEEIMELTGLKAGPTIGKIKKALENAILDGLVENDYEKVKEYFFSIKDAYMQNVEEWEKKDARTQF
ncbi:MAG TPA: HD domain-containing protein, partial [Candidatus Magasanikbacteria bacterium]|nr:HD domain-containing protein [Candidatus Magasanikbacteria bacterium]